MSPIQRFNGFTEKCTTYKYRPLLNDNQWKGKWHVLRVFELEDTNTSYQKEYSNVHQLIKGLESK